MAKIFACIIVQLEQLELGASPHHWSNIHFLSMLGVNRVFKPH